MSNYYVAVDKDGNYVLAHHGVLGMKWGVRRYQNEDGSLTAAGRKRYGVDLDINDTSRTNVARIRKGEAYRKLDNSKRKNPNNTYRHAELSNRVRMAKQAERLGKRIDRGALRVAKGETITSNNAKRYIAMAGAYLASKLLVKSLVSVPMGQYTAKIVNGAAWASLIFGVAYNAKKVADNFNIRTYNATRATGDGAIKRVGSTEYDEVVKRRKNGS